MLEVGYVFDECALEGCSVKAASRSSTSDCCWKFYARDARQVGQWQKSDIPRTPMVTVLAGILAGFGYGFPWMCVVSVVLCNLCRALSYVFGLIYFLRETIQKE